MTALAIDKSRTCRESPILSAVTSSSTRSGMFSGQHFDFDFTSHLIEHPAALRTPSGVPTRRTGTLSVIFSPPRIS